MYHYFEVSGGWIKVLSDKGKFIWQTAKLVKCK